VLSPFVSDLKQEWHPAKITDTLVVKSVLLGTDLVWLEVSPIKLACYTKAVFVNDTTCLMLYCRVH